MIIFSSKLFIRVRPPPQSQRPRHRRNVSPSILSSMGRRQKVFLFRFLMLKNVFFGVFCRLFIYSLFWSF